MLKITAFDFQFVHKFDEWISQKQAVGTLVSKFISKDKNCHKNDMGARTKKN